MRSGGRLVGVGVDLISWKRVERFLAEHSRDRLKRILTPSEEASFQKNPYPAQFFARSFTAKEAYFKALEGSGMSEEFFRNLEIREEGKDRFFIRRRGSLPAPSAEGQFFETPDGLGARVFVWRSKEKGKHGLDLAGRR